MPNRDYATRSRRSKRGVNKALILAIVAILFLVAGVSLWLLKTNAPAPTTPTQTQVQNNAPRSELPSRPEEVYSYIRDLETREVPVDKNSKLAQLTKEQEQQIQRQKEEEQRKLEQKEKATQTAEQAQTVMAETTKEATQPTPPVVKALTPEELEAQKAQELKIAEEKRKQAELKKQQEAKKAEEQAKIAQDKAEAAKKAEQAKIVAKPATESAKATSAGKYGLQCGAFKNRAQAENMQARLAMAGYNARINSNGEWNRVVVGPVGDRAAASTAQSNARSVAECLIVGMN
ncbi:cell division protein FtsN [Pasteurellaceae bacterium 15-036681]|nr:cell division protein FtsN [Pasteurellaceae bacterium 15-036681]